MSAPALERCRFPRLPEPYTSALRRTVEIALAAAPNGLIAAGDIINGISLPRSRLQVYAIGEEVSERGSLHVFETVRCQISVVSPNSLRQRFAAEDAEGRRQVADQIARGFLILSDDASVSELRRDAQAYMSRSPTPLSESQILLTRDALVAQLEAALDQIDIAPSSAALMLNGVVTGMLRFALRRAGKVVAADAELVPMVFNLSPDLAELAEGFFTAADLAARSAHAVSIAERCLDGSESFEWSVELDDSR